MDFQGTIVLLVIVFIIIALIKNLAGPGLVFTIAILVLGVFGILTPGEMISGFSNEQIAVIVMLLILGDIMKKSNFIEMLFFKAFEHANTYRSFMGRMTFITAGLSAFLNNTPLVAVMMPFVHMWSKKNGVAPSKLLIPLSYAAILGGCVTLIGTSTNLIVNGLVADQHIIPGLKTLGIFDFAPVGLSMAFIGIGYILLFSKKILPKNKDFLEKFDANNREYFAEVRVTNNASIHGKSIEDAGLRNLKGLFLVELHRDEQIISPVTPQTKVYSKDILIFAGNTETISDMMDIQRDLQLAQAGMFSKMKHTEMIEVVVSYNSLMTAKTAKEFNFRGKYDAAIIAIHRNGEKIIGKIGNVKMQPGDVLMLIAGDDFTKRAQDNRDFYVINKIKEFNNVSWWKNFLFIAGLITAIITSAMGWIPLFTALLLLIVLLNVVGLASPKEIARGIDFNLIFVIALSLALGTAMVKTGIAHTFASASFEFLKPMGIVGIFAGIFLFTNLLASVVTNKAAVALVFPIVLTMAVELNMNPKPFILLIAFAGAASFITPIGYQTNLMVYGPGGYNFKDFFKMGAPLTVIYMIAAVIILILQFDLSIY